MRKHTKAEMLANCISNSERRRIEMQVPDDESIKKGGDMQSASELGQTITIECFGAALSGKGKGVGDKILSLIRARDREIVEECARRAFDDSREEILSVLRDLG